MTTSSIPLNDPTEQAPSPYTTNLFSINLLIVAVKTIIASFTMGRVIFFKVLTLLDPQRAYSFWPLSESMAPIISSLTTDCGINLFVA